MVNRRKILSLPLVLAAGSVFASTPSKIVNPNEPAAKAIGYVEKTPKPGAVCSNCALAKNTGEKNVPCAIFQNRLVNANGWCKAYAKR